VEELLSHIPDPEIPVVSIRELGILREISLHDGVVQVVITPTYSGCPAMGQIEDDVRAALTAAGIDARVVTRLAPAWTTDWMSEATRAKLRAYGIAPPHTQEGGSARPVGFAQHPMAADAAPCPRCGSQDTTETSHFGSTACKSLWKCLSCLEPFDHFKPY
jgi:ring-1,2-phenylacetyl-CoA epoxidase subunit PaaD